MDRTNLTEHIDTIGEDAYIARTLVRMALQDAVALNFDAQHDELQHFVDRVHALLSSALDRINRIARGA